MLEKKIILTHSKLSKKNNQILIHIMLKIDTALPIFNAHPV